MTDERLSRLRDLQTEVDRAVKMTTKSELVQCARLLATYVAIYKEQYGELTYQEYDVLSRRLVDSTRFGEQVYLNGIKELLETLAVIELRGVADESAPFEDRRLN